MPTVLLTCMCLAVTAQDLIPAADAQPNVPPPGFTALFNGRDLSGWHGMLTTSPAALAAMTAEARADKQASDTDNAWKHWRVENGEVVNDGLGAYLTTDQDYGDIELIVEYRITPQADSGVYLRGTPQVQIWDYTEPAYLKFGADKGSGGLWNNAPGAPGKDPLVCADKPVGQWNRLFIQQIGARTTIYLNGQQVVDHAIMENSWDRQRPLEPRGPIQLQTHGGEIRWRNIFVREIPPQEANQLLQRAAGPGFVSLFNGHDLQGWQGSVEDYAVVDGAIRCQPKAELGGTLYTVEQYGDFVVSLEFRLPPRGNNGLAIRYPGQGDAAYTGMCELQVLDTPAYQGEIDPRQAHGSAYGMVAAAPGYLRPVGEWNCQLVTVKGSTIQVELNGTVILDTDLAEVTEFLDDSLHPGKDLRQGYFGFAGHRDPVEFRNIRIKRLSEP